MLQKKSCCFVFVSLNELCPRYRLAVKNVVKSKSQLILSLMSGTSVDTIDAALCELCFAEHGRIAAKLVAFREHPIPAALREKIFTLFKDSAGSLREACALNFEIGYAFADAAEALLEEIQLAPKFIAAIASHGQTVYHIPPQDADRLGCAASTLQLGEPSAIALRLGIPTIANFRAADMVAGGQGAPLVPFADFHLFSRPSETIVIHNIGGIANSTVLPPGGKLDDVIAFDTGPGNVLIDLFVSRLFSPLPFDADGKIAARGKVIGKLLDEWMNLPFIASPPPKSTGRELFGPALVDTALKKYADASPEDFVATATRFSARAFAQNLCRFVAPAHRIAAIYLSGGGAKNPTLRKDIAEELRLVFGSQSPYLGVVDELGVPAKARECIAFAILGFARLHRIPANVPSATGAKRRVLLGVVYEPHLQ